MILKEGSMATRNTSLYSIALSAAFALAFGHIAHAQGSKKGASAPAASPSAPAPQAGKKADEKVDISDLENKYWAPKDTDFSVVQNRTYSKEHRWFLSPQFGRMVNDQWSEGNLLGVSGNYFWSERMGVQISYTAGSLRDNAASDYIANHFGSGIRADHNRFQSYYGIGYNVVPFYAKMSFWGKKIIYFDMAVTPTLGMTNYEQLTEDGNHSKSSFTYGIDITQFFFFSNYFAIRADLKNQWYSADVARYHSSGGIPTGGKVKSETAQDTLFLLGLTFFY